ncbi:unnamed protein product [Rodentolepis nana]|uniref:Golgi to ER traffic-protein n=1 Tax=Rodentolepis nana TaxID=102285 RepID=A0A0R3T0J0_RODNA|nr:unnamed protein product [Rodentolepis nana]
MDERIKEKLIKPKIKPSTSRSTISANAPTKTVKVVVNPLETDPYDELPTVIELPPVIPPHPNKMDQSLYANFYENYPTGGASEGRNGSPLSRQPSTSPRPTSPKMEEIPGKTVSLLKSTSMNANPTLTARQTSPDLNNKNNQDHSLTDTIPRLTVKRTDLSSSAQPSKPSVRFVDPMPMETAESTQLRDFPSTSKSNPVQGVNESTLQDSLPQTRSLSGNQTDQHHTTGPKSPLESPVNLDNGPEPSFLTTHFPLRLTRSTSTPFNLRQIRPATSFSSWQQTQSRIELLITEALASMERFEKGGSTQALHQKMRNFEQGLSAELSHLDRLCDAFSSGDSSISNFVQQERGKINKERDGPLMNALQRLREPNPEKGFQQLTTSLEKISTSTQAITDTVQLNWFDSTDSEQSKKGSNLDDCFGSLSISDREDSITNSLDSNDPTDLAGLLHVYAAQFHSHCLLVRGTAEEFFRGLDTKVDKSRNIRGYHLPAAGVLIANAKFLLRCSSQLVSLAANLSSALQHLSPSETSNSAEEVERLRSDLETHGNAVCESLKGLIAQTKDVAGCLSSPNMSLPTTAMNVASKPVVILGPEMERLVGAVQDVVAATEALRHTISNSPVLRNCASSHD